MRLCLELAEKGKFFVKANPMVGAVLVDRDGNILSKGYHKAFGKEHAEVSALKKWKEVPKNSILFVNLEPCCHLHPNYYSKRSKICSDRYARSSQQSFWKRGS